MWRSNVLGMRKCSSAAAWRNTRWHSSSASLPVSDDEFWQALGGVDPSFARPKFDSVQRIGFAISGGVDSMALAALFANPESLRKSERCRLEAHAFIVDHKVRPESTEEAEWVAEQCRTKFDMQASVLPLTWPAGFDPSDRKRFETDARTLRYQALGRACRAARIRKLLLAHHADDQAETVLMRLANNRLRSGLQGMQPVEWIPECYGMHGIAHSGAPWSCDKPPSQRDSPPFPIEDGGIRIMRPLLRFEKSRLIATCNEQGVAWAEDKTNHLQTYTSRNAIRHVLKHHELPTALRIRSLVDLSLAMQSRVSQYKQRAKRLLDSCHMKLDFQTGSLSIRFPGFWLLFPKDTTQKNPSLGSDSSLLPTQSELNDARNLACCLLEQVGQLISPRESVPLGDLAATIGNIWPEFLESEDTEPAHNFCIYNIWWRKIDRDLNRKLSNSMSLTAVKYTTINEWLLVRQPLEQYRPGATIQYPPSHIVPLTQDVEISPPSVTDSEYQLFDGRWWISIRNRSMDILTLRLFTQADLTRLSPPLKDLKRGSRHPNRFIAYALSKLLPADLRFTLPAVFRQDPVTKTETLVGFPTLNVSMDNLGYPDDICSWRVRYKKIGLAKERLRDSCAPSITHERIRRALAIPDTRLENFTSAYDCGSSDPSDKKNRRTKPPTVNKRVSPGEKPPIVPVAESKRHGRSEKRDGEGYEIKWGDL